MRSLFQISDDLLALSDLLSDVGGEITDDEAGAALEKFFDELGEERDAKIDNYCALIRELEAHAEARWAEARRIRELSEADERNAERLKNRLKAFLDIQGIAKLETLRFKLSVQKNGGKARLIVPEQWEDEPSSAPERFHRRVIQLDKTAIREAIEAGEEIDGCAIAERGGYIRIR